MLACLTRTVEDVEQKVSIDFQLAGLPMSEEFSASLRYDERSFPGAEWRAYLRACGVKWARTRSSGDGIWYAIEGKGYVVWVSDTRWTGDYWRVSLAVSASAPAAGLAVIEEVVRFALERFPEMRIEKSFGPNDGTS